MTSRIIRGGPGAKFPGELTAIIISCDTMNCDTSLNDKEIEAGGGLVKMGWETTSIGGELRHYCPQHKH